MKSLIVVGVAIDTVAQIESHMLARHYEGFLKKERIDDFSVYGPVDGRQSDMEAVPLADVRAAPHRKAGSIHRLTYGGPINPLRTSGGFFSGFF